ncbi:MAG: hypothetical protein ABSD53_13010 [Terriglobales bacterium]
MTAKDKTRRETGSARIDQIGKVFIVISQSMRRQPRLRRILHAASRRRARDGPLHAGNQDATWKETMQIGRPWRVIVVEPLQSPVEQSAREPEPLQLIGAP